MKKLAFLSGAAAGVAICTGGAVYLSCDNKYAGAFLFSVALLCICVNKLYLYTGRVGDMVYGHSKDDITMLLLGLMGNAAAAILGGRLLGSQIITIAEKAYSICDSKLDQTVPSCLVRACFCGVLMNLAVKTYKNSNGNVAGIFTCVPAFILSGFEHSIADMFYFAASGIVEVRAFAYIWLVIIGNSVGAMLLPLMDKLARSEK